MGHHIVNYGGCMVENHKTDAGGGWCVFIFVSQPRMIYQLNKKNTDSMFLIKYSFHSAVETFDTRTSLTPLTPRDPQSNS